MLETIFEALVKFAAELLMIALPVLAGYLAVIIRRWILLKLDQLRIKVQESSISLDDWALDRGVEIAVMAAEQLKNNRAIQDKKEWAVQEVMNYLFERGVVLPLDEIATAVEAAVWREFNKDEKPEIHPTEEMISR